MAGLSENELILAVTLSFVGFIVIVTIILVVIYRRRRSFDVKERVGEVSDSAPPVHLVHRRRRSTRVYSRAYLHTPPRHKRANVWRTKISKHIYNVNPYPERYSNSSGMTINHTINGSESRPPYDHHPHSPVRLHSRTSGNTRDSWHTVAY